MKKHLYPLTLVILMFSCSPPTQIEKDLRENINKPLHLEMFKTVRQGNNLLSFSELRHQFKYLSVVYLQDGCSPCYPKFVEWHQKMEAMAKLF